jgi:hypothetical protein
VLDQVGYVLLVLDDEHPGLSIYHHLRATVAEPLFRDVTGALILRYTMVSGGMTASLETMMMPLRM